VLGCSVSLSLYLVTTFRTDKELESRSVGRGHVGGPFEMATHGDNPVTSYLRYCYPPSSFTSPVAHRTCVNNELNGISKTADLEKPGPHHRSNVNWNSALGARALVSPSICDAGQVELDHLYTEALNIALPEVANDVNSASYTIKSSAQSQPSSHLCYQDLGLFLSQSAHRRRSSCY
jgi:hypothetical protein